MGEMDITRVGKGKDRKKSEIRRLNSGKRYEQKVQLTDMRSQVGVYCSASSSTLIKSSWKFGSKSISSSKIRTLSNPLDITWRKSWVYGLEG